MVNLSEKVTPKIVAYKISCVNVYINEEKGKCPQ